MKILRLIIQLISALGAIGCTIMMLINRDNLNEMVFYGIMAILFNLDAIDGRLQKED